jgi:acetyltransferase-like isoleucine patch superfamily enzyme
MKHKVRLLIRLIIDSLPPKWQALIDSIRTFNQKIIKGRGTYIHRTVQIIGRSCVQIGTNSVLSQDCWLNVNHRNRIHTSIKIGNNCFIGRRNFFSSGNKISLGDYVLTANDCHFLGSSHIINDPNKPYITSGTTDSDTITIGDNTFLGANVRVLGNVIVGHGCVIGACSIVMHDIPPFSIAIGSPAIVIKRYSFHHKKWIPISDFSTIDENSIPSSDDYISILRNNPNPRMPYIAAGSDMGQC